MRSVLGLCLAAGAAAVFLGCGASGSGGREVDITQAKDGCTPTSIQAAAGEKLNLVVKNESGEDYEIEGIDGAKLEEAIIPEGRTRSVGYDVPGSGGTTKLKCYIPGGVSTIIEVQAGEGSTTPEPGAKESSNGFAGGAVTGSRVAVSLGEYTVRADPPSVNAGDVEFVATNVGKEVHELYVLKSKGNGYDVVGEVEHIEAGGSGSMTLKVAPGEYTLACLIAAGESGSTVDHFKEGMHTPFAVR
jgi:uncharacterized cupredoxin-like copper-binding protein